MATTAPSRDESLTERLERSRAEKLHASSRLDREVSGVVTFARTKQGIAKLAAARERGAYHRHYLGLVCGPLPTEGRWQSPIGPDPRDRRARRVVPEGQGKPAYTEFTQLTHGGALTLLHLRPRTGRTHQLRVHAAHAGVPLLGDARYGGAKRVSAADGRVERARRTMLHCALVRLEGLGVGGADLLLRAPLPQDLRELYVALGGDEADLTAAEVGLTHSATHGG